MTKPSLHPRFVWSVHTNGTLTSEAQRFLRAILDVVFNRTGNETSKVVTGTAGTSGNISKWDANGDLVDGGKAAADLLDSPELSDSVFRIKDNTDGTKKLAFQVSGIATGTTRTWTVPDTDVTVSSFIAGLLNDTTAAAALATLGAIGAIRTQVFTSSGTYTPHANMVFCIIEAVGGGGGGGGCTQNSTSTTYLGGAGGGAGEYSVVTATKADIGASKAVGIGAAGSGAAVGANTGGAGGTTSVGTLCTALGGGGGEGNDNTTPRASAGTGGAGGTGSRAPGAHGTHGGWGVSVSSIYNTGWGPIGRGGDSVWGNGGIERISRGNGNNATGYGAGGGGGVDWNNNGARSGGAGAAGMVIITEFCSS